MKVETRKRIGRLPLVIMAMLCLLTGIWGGLIRLPLNLPLPTENANWISFHGPLMVCGFLGTVISLERAVGLQKWWTYAAPLLTGAGGILLLGGVLGRPGLALLTLGSAVFTVVTIQVVRMQTALFTLLMSAGAAAWLAGNLLWFYGWEVNRVVPWWIAFLALTILGERLDLSRFQRQVRWAQPLLLAVLGLFLGGVVLSLFRQRPGEILAGAGLLGLAGWLGRFDIARRTVTQPGLPRFMAVCLLSGYFWLALAGLLFCISAPMEAGPAYDAVLHSFFLGFIFSMIFGHAPIIFPAVMHLPVAFAQRFYAHLVLLHAGLLVRVLADLAGWPEIRIWGGIFNALAIALFLGNTIASMAMSAFKVRRLPRH